MGITALLKSTPLYSGTQATSGDIPAVWPVGLGGRGFLLDLKSGQFRRESIPLLRQQADGSDRPGEASVNPDDLWRRVQSSWHSGAGQRNYDSIDGESVASRYWRSKGVDPWTRGEIRLHHDTAEKKSSASTNLRLVVAGDYLYLLDGSSLQYTQDITATTPTWTDITGESGTAGTALTSDGYTVYSAHGADGVYVTTRGGASTAKGVDGTVSGLKYVKGRLFGWAANDLYNITAIDDGTPEPLPTALLTHANSDFAWVDAAEGPGYYFFAGYSGDKSTIYASKVKDDGTGLEVPMVSADLPDGEIVRSIYGYLGFLLVGTDKGIRFATSDTSGALTLGGLITDATEVRCFEGQDRFVWFGWSQFDATSTGLGRLDLSVFNGVRPAYASDLMATENGDVLSVVTFQDIRVFAVSGDGIFAETTDVVASGTIETGRITYGLHDSKVSQWLTVSHEPLAGAVAASLARDGADYEALGAENDTANSTQSDFSTNRARAESFDVKLTLARSSTSTSAGPVVGRITFRSYPAAARSEQILLPLLLGKNQVTNTGSVHGRDVVDDLRFLASLEDGTPTSYQEAGLTFAVVVEDHAWLPHHLEDDKRAFNGTYLAKLKRFAQE